MSYDAGSIVVLEGLQAVRMRPAMYVGSTGAEGVMQLVVEVLQNALDEALVGQASRLDATVDDEGCWVIADNGRGIPLGDHPTLGRPVAEVVRRTRHVKDIHARRT